MSTTPSVSSFNTQNTDYVNFQHEPVMQQSKQYSVSLEQLPDTVELSTSKKEKNNKKLLIGGIIASAGALIGTFYLASRGKAVNIAKGIAEDNTKFFSNLKEGFKSLFGEGRKYYLENVKKKAAEAGAKAGEAGTKAAEAGAKAGEEVAQQGAKNLSASATHIREQFEEKFADGEITGLSDALEVFSEKQLKEAGLYNMLASKEALSKGLTPQLESLQRGIQEKIDDLQIEDLDDALKYYSEKELVDTGMYHKLAEAKPKLKTVAQATSEAGAKVATEATQQVSKDISPSIRHIIEQVEEKSADGEITGLSDALEVFSEKELKEAGLYNMLASKEALSKELTPHLESIRQSIQDKVADLQISSLDEALQEFSMDEIINSGMYDELVKLSK